MENFRYFLPHSKCEDAFLIYLPGKSDFGFILAHCKCKDAILYGQF